MTGHPRNMVSFLPSPSCPLLHCLHRHLSLLPSLLTTPAPPIFSSPLANFSNPCHYSQSSDVEIVGIPEELDITSLRGRGLQPDEEELPEGDAPPTDPEPVAVEIDEGIVMQLVSMGFDVEGCKKAVFHTKNRGNQGNLETSCNQGNL